MTGCSEGGGRVLALYAAVLFLLLALASLAAAAEMPASEEELKKSMGLEGYSFVYQMPDGTEIK